ncbi:hypothetical protein BH18ACI4_BH18ACI4_15580 [soil metagenome]
MSVRVPNVEDAEVMHSARAGDVVFFEVLNRCLSLGIVSETKGWTFTYEMRFYHIPISKMIGGLHGLGTGFAEYDFSLDWGCAVSDTPEFDELFIPGQRDYEAEALRLRVELAVMNFERIIAMPL